MGWAEACGVVLQVWSFGDGIEVVEVEAVVCGVLWCVVVDGHSAEPAWTVFALAFEEEFLAVFFELASAFADLAAVADHDAVTPQSLENRCPSPRIRTETVSDLNRMPLLVGLARG